MWQDLAVVEIIWHNFEYTIHNCAKIFQVCLVVLISKNVTLTVLFLNKVDFEL